MKDRVPCSIKEARELLGGVSCNSIYRIVGRGGAKSVVIGSRRFTSGRLRATRLLAWAVAFLRRCNPSYVAAGHCRSLQAVLAVRYLQHALVIKAVTFIANCARSTRA